jgi:hypothetical protein
MKMNLKRHAGFWLGFSIALGGVLAGAVLAFGSSGNRPRATLQPAIPPATPASAISILSRTGTVADRLPAAAVNALRSVVPPAEIPSTLNPGTPAGAQAKLALRDLGTDHVSLYIVPTSKGQVCSVFSADYGTMGCFDRFTEETPISWSVADPDRLGAGIPAIVTGIVPDSVTAVDVKIDGQDAPAALANNAFFYEVPAAASWPQAIVATFANGAIATIDVAPAPQGH